MTPHWTDDTPRPAFTTVIRTTGPSGNIYAILGTACNYLHRLDVPHDPVCSSASVERRKSSRTGAGRLG